LDNRRENLRVASRTQNLGNQRKQAGKTNPFKGVWWHEVSGKWRASIQVNGKQKHLGMFVDPVDAALAYDTAARSHFGAFAHANFPLEILAVAA